MTALKQNSNSNYRYEVIDIIRGFAVINMVAFHLIWDLVYVYRVNFQWFKGSLGFIWQQIICITFILVSGFSVSFSRKLYKRGFIVFIGGALVSLVTFLLMPENLILFGILTFIGSSMLVFSVLKNPLSKINCYLGAVISVILFVLFRNVEYGYIGIRPVLEFELPDWLYSGYISAYFGFPNRSFVSSDYFPLIPWFFLFCVGFYLYKIAEKKALLKYLRIQNLNPVFKPLLFIGKNSFFIYLVHQPVVYILLLIIFKGIN